MQFWGAEKVSMVKMLIASTNMLDQGLKRQTILNHLNLLPSQGRPYIFGNNVQTRLYHYFRSITFEKFTDTVSVKIK